MPGAGAKTAYLVEKNMPTEKMSKILDKAKQAREAGATVNIAIMKKNKKFQKEQLTKAGYDEFREYYREELKH